MADWRSISYGGAAGASGSSSGASLTENIIKVVNYLKTVDRHIKVTAAQIRTETDVELTPPLVEALRNNEKVTVNPSEGAAGETFSFKSKLNVPNGAGGPNTSDGQRACPMIARRSV